MEDAMRIRIAACLFSFFFIAAACSDVSGPHSAGKRYVGYPPSKSMGYYVDWFDCSSYDGGESWDCVYNHTDENSGEPDYWDPYHDFYTTGDCSMVPRYCDNNFQPTGGSSPYTNPRNVVRMASDNQVLPIPNCPAKSTDSAGVKAWCAAHTPTTTELGHLQTALTRMHQIGGICDTLATIGDSLVAHGTLRFFPQAAFRAGGQAPLNGGASGPNSWAQISEDVVDRMWDAAHMGISTDPNSGNTYPADLQTTLTHELDHLKGNSHLRNPDGTENLVMTANMRTCADFQW